jgi:hypothetical protein
LHAQVLVFALGIVWVGMAMLTFGRQSSPSHGMHASADALMQSFSCSYFSDVEQV